MICLAFGKLMGYGRAVKDTPGTLDLLHHYCNKIGKNRNNEGPREHVLSTSIRAVYAPYRSPLP